MFGIISLAWKSLKVGSIQIAKHLLLFRGKVGVLQSPNYIHFRNEWQILGLDPPGQWPNREFFQKLMNQLNALPISADFDDFSYRADRCEMGRLRGNPPEGGQAFTKLVCRSNQITLVEEWAETTADEFKDKFTMILKEWFKLSPNTAIIAQRCCLRALVQPAKFADSRNFLGDRIMNIGPAMHQTFKSMPFRVGFTFTCLRKTQDYNLFIDTTINSWRDKKTVWVQVEGVYPMERPINATNPEVAKLPFEDCKSFLEDEVLGFLNQFDTNEAES